MPPTTRAAKRKEREDEPGPSSREKSATIVSILFLYWCVSIFQGITSRVILSELFFSSLVNKLWRKLITSNTCADQKVMQQNLLFSKYIANYRDWHVILSTFACDGYVSSSHPHFEDEPSKDNLFKTAFTALTQEMLYGKCCPRNSFLSWRGK